ncbi:MAG: DUF2243 domain-containing protein, partial [Oscillochloridaceae bacterium umkhey_bin13]
MHGRDRLPPTAGLAPLLRPGELAVGLRSDGLLHAAELLAIVAGGFLLGDLLRQQTLARRWAWAGLFLGAGGFQHGRPQVGQLPTQVGINLPRSPRNPAVPSAPPDDGTQPEQPEAPAHPPADPRGDQVAPSGQAGTDGGVLPAGSASVHVRIASVGATRRGNGERLRKLSVVTFGIRKRKSEQCATNLLGRWRSL